MARIVGIGGMAMLRALVGIGVAAGLVLLVAGPGRATADRPSACQQWEVMLGQQARMTIDAKSLPEAGKPLVEPSPVGWEPFAFGPAGQLVYRRCTR